MTLEQKQRCELIGYLKGYLQFYEHYKQWLRAGAADTIDKKMGFCAERTEKELKDLLASKWSTPASSKGVF